MPVTLYSNRASAELPATGHDTWTREKAVKVTGDLVFKEAIYTLTAGTDEATGDILRICKLPAGVILLPSLCKIIAQDPGTAFNIAKIGDVAVDLTTADNDDDRYSGAIDLSAGGIFDFLYAAAAAGLAGYVLPREMWITATLGTVTAPTAGQTIRFVIVYAVQS